MNVLLVGGGIGGLCAATVLAKAGHAVTLVEQRPRFEPVGAGILLAANASRLLSALGVDLEARAQRVKTMSVADERGRVLQSFDAGAFAARFGPTFAATRPALHEALASAVPSSVRLVFGSSVAMLKEQACGVLALLEGASDEARFDVVVGCDGLHSRVRELVMGARRLRYSGSTCWRAVVKNPGFEGVTEALGRDGVRLGLVPLRDGQLYLFLVRPAPPRAPAPAWPGEFKQVFGSLGGGLERALDALDGPPPLHHDLWELDGPEWGRGRVLLLGDAAHAMTPNQGQGAAMAIEDAFALGQALSTGADGALERYEALRHERVRAVQLDSRRLGEVFHLKAAPLRWMRNLALRVTPDAVMTRHMERLVKPGLALATAAGSWWTAVTSLSESTPMTLKIGSALHKLEQNVVKDLTKAEGALESGAKKVGAEVKAGWGDVAKVAGQVKDGFEVGAAEAVGYAELAGVRYPVSSYESKVSDTLTRGSRIDDPKNYGKLKEQGFKGIVDLTAEGTNDEKYAKQAGLNLLNTKIIDNTAPTIDQMKQVLDFIQNPANQPAYVHCEAGKGRTGCAVACYRMAVQGWTLDQAVAEGKKFGLALPNQIDFLKKFDTALTAGQIQGYHR